MNGPMVLSALNISLGGSGDPRFNGPLDINIQARATSWGFHGVLIGTFWGPKIFTGGVTRCLGKVPQPTEFVNALVFQAPCE